MRAGTDQAAGGTESTARAPVRVRLLGGFELTCRDRDVRLESGKSSALLAYLALCPGPHTRAKLAGLLWPDLEQERAARNLRHALWDQRRRLAESDSPPALLATRVSIELGRRPGLWIDADEFLAACSRLEAAAGAGKTVPHGELEELSAGVAHYRGELLDGHFLGDAPEFETWLAIERERLRALAIGGFARLAREYRMLGEHAAGLTHARRVLALDPWREEAHREVMELLALAGQRAAALAQFDACRRILAEDLQTVPTPATVEPNAVSEVREAAPRRAEPPATASRL